MKGEVLLPEKYLEVGFTPDGREIIINHPVDPETIRLGFGHLVFSPSQARHLAKLLLRKADECSPSRPENLSTGPALSDNGELRCGCDAFNEAVNNEVVYLDPASADEVACWKLAAAGDSIDDMSINFCPFCGKLAPLTAHSGDEKHGNT